MYGYYKFDITPKLSAIGLNSIAFYIKNKLLIDEPFSKENPTPSKPQTPDIASKQIFWL